jgi:PAS domain S-box-containing protein
LKDKRTNELAAVKVELEQQNNCLNKAAIVSETDADFNITLVNNNFCELYGYHRAELIGRNHRILKSGKQPDTFFTDMISTIRSGKVFKSKVLNKQKGGQLCWMDITIMPFKDLNGEIFKYVAIMFDVNSQSVQKEVLLKQGNELAIVNTELAFQNDEKEKRADELAIANTELAFQNSEKQKRADELAIANKELAERTLKLNQALEKQKELNELKSRFVSTASHEFRTPLSSITFAAGSIKKYWAKMEPIIMRKKLEKIEDQVLHMTKLLDDVLIVGKAEAGKIIQTPVKINLGDFIHEIIEEVSSAIKYSHDIALIDTENLKTTDIFIDEKLGRNIFINLIGNAVKYTPNAKNVTVALSSEKEYTVITITDYGIGISKSELKDIFKPFSRGKNVDLIQGTGLGLTIAKDAIDIMGGQIIVNSTIGKGTSFIVKILNKQHV